MIPPPPRSPLFPYTTLFRSAAHALPGAVTYADLASNLAPTYIKLIPANDGWSQPSHFAASVAWVTGGQKCYLPMSYGRDGVSEASPFGAKTDFDCDIVYSGGIFLSYRSEERRVGQECRHARTGRRRGAIFRLCRHSFGDPRTVARETKLMLP